MKTTRLQLQRPSLFQSYWTLLLLLLLLLF
jgi:hypothetical protein